MARRLPTRQENRSLVAGAPGAFVPVAAFARPFSASQIFARQAINTTVAFANAAEVEERTRLRRQGTELTNEATRELTDLQFRLDEDPDFDTHNKRFADESAAIQSRALQRADPRIQPDIALKLERMSDNAGFNVRTRVRKKQIDGGRAAILESSEIHSRLAALAPTPQQRAMAIQAYEEDLAGGLEDGFFTKQEAAVKRQQFRERVDLIGALELVNRAPAEAARALGNSKVFPDLDPLRRIELKGQAERAARADNDVGLELAENYVAALEAGALPDQAREQAIVAQLGSPKEATRFGEAVERTIFVRQTSEALKFLPPEEQVVALNKLKQDPNAPGFSADRQEDLGRVTKQLVLAHQHKQEDPRDFVEPLVAKDMQRYRDTGQLVGEDETRVETTLALRHQRAVGVANPLPLSSAQASAEADALERLDARPAAERLASIVESQGQAATDQVASKLRGRTPHLSLAAMHAGQGAAGIRLAEEIIDGQRILSENKDLAPTPTDSKHGFSLVFPNLFDVAPEARAPFLAATNAIYAKSIAGTDGTFDSGLYDQAARQAGGAVLEADGGLRGGPFQHRGRTVLPVAPGLGEDETLNALAQLDDEALALYGNGAPVDAAGGAITARHIQEHGQLISFGFGRYNVQFEGKTVFKAGGREIYQLNLAQFVADRPGAIGRPAGAAHEFPGGDIGPRTLQ